ncbi:MAG: fibronectin type III domain-containing protein [Acidobacteriota bacterium]
MTRPRSFLWMLTLLAAYSGALQPLLADAATADGALADAADRIVIGQVVAEPSTSATAEAKDYSVAVATVIKGRVLHSPVRVRLPAARPPVSTLFSPRQRLLLFLDDHGSQDSGDGALRVLGAFHLYRLGEREVADPDFWEGHYPSLEGWGPQGPRKIRDLASFSHWLTQRALGQPLAADYWLDAAPETLRDAYRAQARRISANAVAPGWVKASQPAGSVSDPAGDVVVINALSNNSPDFVSAQLSSTGSNLRITVRHLPTSFDPQIDQTYLFIDLDSNPGTGSSALSGVGTEVLVRILGSRTAVSNWNSGSSSFEEVATLPTTTLSDGYFVSVPLGLLQGDALFTFRFANEVRIDNRHTAFLDFMPDLNLPPVSMSVPLTVPAPPAGLQAVLTASDRITLSWSDNSDNEDRFEVERRIGGGGFQQVAVVGQNTTSWQDSGLAPAITFTYRVRARNEAGASGFSNTASTTTPGEVAPTGLSAVPLSTSEIELTWTDNAAGESGYRVEMRPPSGEFGLIQSLPANSETTRVAGLDEGTIYTFRVQATGGSGDSSYSNEATTSTFSSSTGPCVAGPTTLCLNQGRFQVEVTWGDFAGNSGPATDAGLVSADSGLFYFFSPNNWEMLVKVLDGCAINDRFWVFAAATTDVEYTLTVSDTLTGFVETYINPLGTAAPAVTDTDAFATCAAQPPAGGSPVSAATSLASSPSIGLQTPGFLGRSKQASCVPSSDTLCLNQGRFRVEVDWVTQTGTGRGTVDAFQSTDSGLFWFFSPENLEMLVKVLDACALNQRVWVFAAATTDVEYTLTVTDTVTGDQKQYFNTSGNAADAVTDTDAFRACTE